MNKIIEINHLKAHYIIGPNGNNTVHKVKAVDDVSLCINEGEIIGITGESGCGKSTLSKMIYGLIKPPLTVVNGSIFYNIDGKSIDIFKLDRLALSKIWWKIISYVPQGSMSVLNPTSRIKDQFLDVIKAHEKDIKKKEAEKMILRHIDMAGLPLDVATSYPHQLSGGMRQRAVIALATILNPRIILADEPTTALDVVVQRGILQHLIRTQQELKFTLIVVSHDMGVHAQIAHRIVIMYAGKIVEVGLVNELFKAPLHPYTEFLISSRPKIGDKFRTFKPCSGPPSLINPPAGCRYHQRCSFSKDICEKNEPSLREVEPGHYAACHLLEVK